MTYKIVNSKHIKKMQKNKKFFPSFFNSLKIQILATKIKVKKKNKHK